MVWCLSSLEGIHFIHFPSQMVPLTNSEETSEFIMEKRESDIYLFSGEVLLIWLEKFNLYMFVV